MTTITAPEIKSTPSSQASAVDRKILRPLATRKAELARLAVNGERTRLWKGLNSLRSERALSVISQIPWEEMNPDGELTLRCEDPYLRTVEEGLRQELYMWDHLQWDMVVDPVYYVELECGPKGVYADYGIEAKTVQAEGGHDVGYAPVIHSEADVEKLRAPRVWVDHETTDRRVDLLRNIFGDLLPVQKRGLTNQWMAPWDQMIHWYGIEKLYGDMIERPELVHCLLQKFTAATLEVLEKQEAMGLLAAGNGNYPRGSGGLAFCDELPGTPYDPAHVTPMNQWGCSTGQIFSSVSPEMHEEFCLRYEKPYLSRFKMTYYGCCEPLHGKMGILREVPNLRAVSMSPWINVEAAVKAVGADYVFSFKPNPALLASETWNPAAVEEYLRNLLEKARGCHVEIILKDITTVRREPQRLWEWADITRRLIAEYYR